MNNKKDTILLIGNGASVLNNNFGHLIDQFDTIARINNYNTRDYKHIIGERTDIWFNGANKGLKKRKFVPQEIIVFVPFQVLEETEDEVIQRTPKRLSLNPSQYTIVHKDIMKKYEDLANIVRPTTGLNSILWCIENYDEVIIHGFDFFITSRYHYFDSKITKFLIDFNFIERGEKHDNVQEKKYVHNLIKNKKVLPLSNYIYSKQKPLNNQKYIFLNKGNSNYTIINIINILKDLNIKYCLGGRSLLGINDGNINKYISHFTFYIFDVEDNIIDMLVRKLIFKKLFTKKIKNTEDNYLKVRRKLIKYFDNYNDFDTSFYKLYHMKTVNNNYIGIKSGSKVVFDKSLLSNLKNKNIELHKYNFSIDFPIPKNCTQFINQYKNQLILGNKRIQDYIYVLTKGASILRDFNLPFWLDELTALYCIINNNSVPYNRKITFGINYLEQKDIDTLIERIRAFDYFYIENGITKKQTLRCKTIKIKFIPNGIKYINYKMKKKIATYIANYNYYSKVSLCINIYSKEQDRKEFKEILYQGTNYKVVKNINEIMYEMYGVNL